MILCIFNVEKGGDIKFPPSPFSKKKVSTKLLVGTSFANRSFGLHIRTISSM
jgi:hypothetical protein